MAKKNGRVYWRERGGESRAYGDFRDYADVGGGREALKAPGARYATTDPDIAAKLVSDRLEELQEARRGKVLTGMERQAGLKEFAAHHMTLKAESGKFVLSYLTQVQKHLSRATEFFGADRPLDTIGTPDIQRWMEALRKVPNGRGGTLADKTVRDHLNSLSNLYRRAMSEAVVPPGYNPVAGLMDKPTPTRQEARWLEVPEGALLLEAARRYEPPKDKHGIPFMHPLLATFLLTGGRKSEVLGLEVGDVSFDRGTVTFRPHEHRRLKTRNARRSVPLFPQLQEILLSYLNGPKAPKEGLLFPSPRTGKMIRDTRKALDTIAEPVGWKEGEIRLHLLRHTFCAASLQLVDRGAPISPYTVARWMGHGGRSLVDRVYGHLGEIRHRSEVVEFRVEQHREELGDRLKLLEAAA